MSAEYTSEEPQQGEEEKSSLGRGSSFELEENHFSPHHHADVLSMQSVEEIETAIVKCKESILSIHEPSEEKRVLVQRLVRLRLRHQELVEIDIYKDPAREIKMIQSHRFSSHGVLQLRLNSSQIYCETCSGLIWIPVQHCFVCSGTNRFKRSILTYISCLITIASYLLCRMWLCFSRQMFESCAAGVCCSQSG